MKKNNELEILFLQKSIEEIEREYEKFETLVDNEDKLQRFLEFDEQTTSILTYDVIKSTESVIANNLGKTSFTDGGTTIAAVTAVVGAMASLYKKMSSDTENTVLLKRIANHLKLIENKVDKILEKIAELPNIIRGIIEEERSERSRDTLRSLAVKYNNEIEGFQENRVYASQRARDWINFLMLPSQYFRESKDSGVVFIPVAMKLERDFMFWGNVPEVTARNTMKTYLTDIVSSIERYRASIKNLESDFKIAKDDFESHVPIWNDGWETYKDFPVTKREGVYNLRGRINVQSMKIIGWQILLKEFNRHKSDHSEQDKGPRDFAPNNLKMDEIIISDRVIADHNACIELCGYKDEFKNKTIGALENEGGKWWEDYYRKQHVLQKSRDRFRLGQSILTTLQVAGKQAAAWYKEPYDGLNSLYK